MARKYRWRRCVASRHTYIARRVLVWLPPGVARGKSEPSARIDRRAVPGTRTLVPPPPSPLVRRLGVVIDGAGGGGGGCCCCCQNHGCRNAASAFMRRSGSHVRQRAMKSKNSSSCDFTADASVLEFGRRLWPRDVTTGRGAPVLSKNNLRRVLFSSR